MADSANTLPLPFPKIRHYFDLYFDRPDEDLLNLEYKDFGDYFKRLRSQLFVNQDEAATYRGIDRSNISRYEDKKKTLPQLNYFCLLAVRISAL